MRSLAWVSERPIVRHGAGRSLVLAGAALATLGFALAAWPKLPQLASAVHLLPPGDPSVEVDRQIAAEFGVQRPVVWVVAARDGTVWTRPALERLRALTREVFTIPGVIPSEVMSLASPNVRDLRVTEDALEPVYLMAQVPATEEAVAALRRQVEANPNYYGTLVSLDGRAAMVVADFRADADAGAIAAAALKLRDRHRGAEVAVYVAGEPVLAATLPASAPPVAAVAVAIGAVGLAVLATVAGTGVALGALAASVLAMVWSAAVLVACGLVVLPWSAYALLPALLVAVVLTTAPAGASLAAVAAALVAGFAALAVVAGAPADAFGVAGAVGVAAAFAAAEVVHVFTRAREPEPSVPMPLRVGVALLVVVTAAGAVRLRASYGAFGYGERYPPAAAVEDLRALGTYFPPPAALAVRVRGEPGFVTSPEVLEAFDGVAAAVRDDPAVARVLSLADLVKLVNQAFNDNRPEFHVIPREPGMAGRYLALAYSPGFRRFVDRSFSRAAIWIYLSRDSAADLARVRAKIERHLAAQPIPNATVDPLGGDGAISLAVARVIGRLGRGMLALLAVTALVLAASSGRRAAARAVAGALWGGALVAGGLGWLGVPLDLVSIACILAAVIAGIPRAVSGDRCALDLAFAIMALLAFAASDLSGSQLGIVAGLALLGPVAAAMISGVTADRDA